MGKFMKKIPILSSLVRNSYQNTIFLGEKNYYYQIMCIFAHELSTNTK